MYSKLTIKCKSNPDYNGTWDKYEVQTEMAELGISLKNKQQSDVWIEYILSHVFEIDDIDDATIEAICMPNAMSISWMSQSSGMVEIKKS